MTKENYPLSYSQPDEPVEISLAYVISDLASNPKIACGRLLGAKNMQDNEHPSGNGIRLRPRSPLEITASQHNDVVQRLMAVVALGRDIALGIVSANDADGGKLTYASVILDEIHRVKKRREAGIDLLRERKPVDIGRHLLEERIGR